MPADAKRLLARNFEGNRGIRKAHAAYLAGMMENGTFNSENGETIKVGTDGRLYDGQHRLMAQVMAGVPMKWLVVTIDKPEIAFKTIDNGARRGVADYFPDMKNRNTFGAVATFQYMLDKTDIPLVSAINFAVGVKGGNLVQRDAVVDYGNDHAEELATFAEYGNRLYHATNNKGGAANYAKFASLVSFVGEGDCLEEFVIDYCTIAPTNSICAVLMKQILCAYSEPRKPDKVFIIGSMLDAYSHFERGKDSALLNKRTAKLKEYDRKLSERREQR